MTHVCPSCGETAVRDDHSIGADHNLTMFKRKPDVGDLVMCANCTEIWQFDEAMDLTMPSLEMLMALSPAQNAMLDTYKDRVKTKPKQFQPVPGDRIGAIMQASLKHGKVEVLGFGVYEGDFVPPKEINPTLNQGIPNARLKLDNGQIVWGCECWWGSEAEMQGIIKDFKKVTQVDIEELRKKANEKHTKTTGQSTSKNKGWTAAAHSKRGTLRWRWSK